ncbi:hypothetical protein [Pelobacter propionicus]|nr:hypothetical protein [Pelobacter propionicus]
MSVDVGRSIAGRPAPIGRWCWLFMLCSVALLMTACAATSNVVTDEEIVTNQKPMATYTSLLLRDFELKRELYDDGDERMGEREQRYERIPAQLTEQIQRYVKARRVYESVSRTTELTPKTLILQGKFIRMGRFRITIEALLLDGASGQEVAYFRQTLWDVLDTSEAVGRLGREVANFLDRIQYK